MVAFAQQLNKSMLLNVWQVRLQSLIRTKLIAVHWPQKRRSSCCMCVCWQWLRVLVDSCGQLYFICSDVFVFFFVWSSFFSSSSFSHWSRTPTSNNNFLLDLSFDNYSNRSLYHSTCQAVVLENRVRSLMQLFSGMFLLLSSVSVCYSSCSILASTLLAATFFVIMSSYQLIGTYFLALGSLEIWLIYRRLYGTHLPATAHPPSPFAARIKRMRKLQSFHCANWRYFVYVCVVRMLGLCPILRTYSFI